VVGYDLRWGLLAMPYIVSGKVKLYFEENGCGYPIIFLHDFESDSIPKFAILLATIDA
jgi:hypothetical protein